MNVGTAQPSVLAQVRVLEDWRFLCVASVSVDEPLEGVKMVVAGLLRMPQHQFGLSWVRGWRTEAGCGRTRCPIVNVRVRMLGGCPSGADPQEDGDVSWGLNEGVTPMGTECADLATLCDHISDSFVGLDGGLPPPAADVLEHFLWIRRQCP